MAQQQLVAHRVGHELLPGLPGRVAAQFGQWAINWARDNPQQLNRLTQETMQWIRQNAPEFRESAWHMTQAMRERIANMQPGEYVLGALGATAGALAGGPGGMVAGATAGAALARDPTLGGTITTREVAVDEHGDIPDLGDLIPENPPNNAGGNMEVNGNGRRPAAGPPTGEPEAQRLAVGGPNGVSKGETPVSPWPNISYGLQETHTTIIPWTGWITGVGMEEGGPLKLEVRMNSIFDMIINGLTTPPAVGAVYATKGFYATSITSDAKRSALTYPQTYSGATTEQPAWRNYWCNLYDYYTVVGCEYKFTIMNPSESRNNSIICGTQFDTYTDVGGQAQNIMPNTRLAEVMSYKNIKWDIIESDALANAKSVVVIQGTYKPGQAKRNIINDGDTKTWIWTGSAGAAPSGTPNKIPNMKENITLCFWRAPLAANSNGQFAYGVNIQMELKYLVQFKDLREQARYPNTVSAVGNNIVTNLSIDPTASGSALQSW